MKTFFKIFFLTLGGIFFLLIVLGVYLFVADPFEIRPFIERIQSNEEPKASKNTPADDHPYLNEEQEELLSNFGIDPAAFPTEITPEIEACAREKLGDERIGELMQGAEPTGTDVFRLRGCL